MQARHDVVRVDDSGAWRHSRGGCISSADRNLYKRHCVEQRLRCRGTDAVYFRPERTVALQLCYCPLFAFAARRRAHRLDALPQRCHVAVCAESSVGSRARLRRELGLQLTFPFRHSYGAPRVSGMGCLEQPVLHRKRCAYLPVRTEGALGGDCGGTHRVDARLEKSIERACFSCLPLLFALLLQLPLALLISRKPVEDARR
jgi:hypothetical protein